jgi:UDPglucose 6-dehydrogenase
MNHKIGIVGAGFVGSACEIGFSSLPKTRVSVHDKFKPSETLDSVVGSSDIMFVCVPTPMRADGSCNSDIVCETVGNIARRARKPKTIVIKSTVPPGTTRTLQKLHPTHEIVFNPEFLTEAKFIDDFINQDRVILGCEAGRRCERLSSFYKQFVEHQKRAAEVIWTDSMVAETAKYATNCFLATKVLFFNEIYQICSSSNVDFAKVTSLLKKDVRIGTSHMQVPGPDGKLAVGGKCLVKDLRALIFYANDLGINVSALDAVWEKILELRPERDWEKIPGATFHTPSK